MNVGILGTGFGVHHAELYRKIEGVDSITIFGRDEEKLERIRKEHPIHTTNEITDILENPTIDLVDVCLPSSLHKQYVIEALKNGKHVFCETPVALTMENAEAMLIAEQKYGRKVFVNQFIKHEHPYEYLYAEIQNEALGKLKSLHIKRMTPPLWGDLSLHKITTDLMIHDFDFVTWLLGSPSNITSQGKNSKQGQSYALVILNYDETVVRVEGSSMMPFGHPFTVGYEAIFDNGSITYQEDGYEDRNETKFLRSTHNNLEQIELIHKNCYEESIREVIDCCKNDSPSRLSLKAAVEALAVSIEAKEQLLTQ
ncbi:Gfo/Idh/MocA family protein [Ornithinibacillus scapharcae]|uniref:Gfo/Idh/MocA family protein n=1 Tax=Ornithinibacillus scapharcae TaxID=1147159 RepID=UPI000225B833|nr:Gfo/Idh/MocA family oxidoreductase [Ornithinibacillus scapharcae]